MSRWSTSPVTWSPMPMALTNRKSITEFLKAQMVLRQARGSPTEFTNYVIKNCAELLDMALLPDGGEYAKRAFVILSTASYSVVSALIADDLFFVKATEILSDITVPSVVVSRLSSLFNHILIKFKTSFVESVGVLMQLLRFIDEPSVFSLFSSIVEVKSKVKDLPLILAKTNFASLILNEFEGEFSTDKIANLCSIVRLCLKHPALQDAFTTDRVLDTLTSLLDSNDTIVLNQLWQALSSFCGAVSGAKMQKVVEQAITVLKASNEQLHMYHVCACDFLSKILFYSPALMSDVWRKDIISISLRMMQDHGNASNLMGSVFRMLRTGVKSQVFLTTVITQLVPVMIGYATSKVRTAVAANSMSFLSDVEDSRTNNKVVHKNLEQDKMFCQFREQILMPFMQFAKQEYGGPVTRYVKKSNSCGDVFATHPEDEDTEISNAD